MAKPTQPKSQRGALLDARNAGMHFITMSFVFSIFVNLLMLTGPLFMLQVYDRVLGSGSEETLVALFMLVAFLYLLMGVLDYARGRIMARYGARFQSLLDSRIFHASFDARGQGRGDGSIGLRDVETIQGFFAAPVFLALMDIPWSPIFIAAIFVFHPWLGWLALGGAAVLVVISILNQVLTNGKVARAHGVAQDAQTFADKAHAAHEIVNGQAMRSALAGRWIEKRRRALAERVASADWTGSFSAVTKSFRLFLQSAMLALGAWLVLEGELTAGAMIAASILLGRALAPVEQSLNQWPVVQRARAAWRRLDKLLSDVPEQQRFVALPFPDSSFSVSNLTLIVPGTRQVLLSGVSFRARPGTAVGIIGKSGSGKSSLARALIGLRQPANGEIRLGGVELHHYDPEMLGRAVGYLPQQVSLLPGTVAENIARMSATPDDEKVIRAAQQANAHDMINHLPDGYNTYVDGDDNQLSGGQRQRIALARALYDSPAVVVLDEPNSALDHDGSMALNKAVRDLKAEGKLVIIMTHRPSVIVECEELVVLDGGKVVSAGPRDEIIRAQTRNADPGVRVKTAVGAKT